MTRERTDVVVVGAGPTGLLLAIELTLGGADVVVIERLSEPDQTIKAGAIGALAGEALERRGLADAMDAVERAMAESMSRLMKGADGQSELPFKKFGGHFSGIFLIDQTRQHEPDRRLRGVNQQALEKMLGERARALGIEIRRGCELIDFGDHGDGVVARTTGASGDVELHAAYLVGCDGGRSAVRKRAGFDFPGTDPTLTGHQAIVELDYPDRLLPVGWRRTPVGMMAYGPIPGRVFLAEFDGPPADRSAPVTREEIETTLRRISGADVRVTAVKTATRFTDHARQATDYRRGRILLVGDAAHVHSPFGGQGLNLGLLDAVNLGWKLAAVVCDRMPESLLDSYTEERHPIAAKVLANTRAQVALMRPDAMTDALRDIVAELMSLDEGTRYFGEMISGIKIRYDLGSDHPLVGRLAGNFALGDDGAATTLFDQMEDGRAVLLDATGSAASAIAAHWDIFVRCMPRRSGPSLLIRPDACIAWAADDADTMGLDAALVRWFGPATH
ncbi:MULTISPECIES: FAD-dependent oxidoreductase [unclassified Bradyrhizobium]|uniref:FAD-dependent oxidoreductase n=1 Tax=unclassified Bradyrhizobium TaxID=2631580 RepID=UPI0018DC4451|nr:MULTISPECIES: FAD-dependent oxidoreductase [unclassified Bradyrhizobium]